MTRPTAISTVFPLLLLVGGLWIAAAEILSSGTPQRVVVPGMGIAFVSVYVWLLVLQVRRLLAGPEKLLRALAAIGFNLLLLLAIFGWVYLRVGIVDNTMPGSPVVTSFATCVYYSVVTFTTLGYGDFYPQGAARVLAAVQALTGYLILGILASSAASILSPHAKPDIDLHGRERQR